MNSDYGVSVGLGAWTFEPGVWGTVAERVKLNTVGDANGGPICLIICRDILTGGPRRNTAVDQWGVRDTCQRTHAP